MICHDTADTRTGQGPDPVALVMAHLAAADAAPDLELLACAAAAALPALAPHGRLACVVNGDRAALLDSTWNPQRPSCLLAVPGAEPQWAALETGFGPLAEAVQGLDGVSTLQLGPLPGGDPWPWPTPLAQAGYYLLPLKVWDHVVAVLVLIPGVEAAQGAGSVTAGLAEVGRALGVVTDLWASTRTLSEDLNQARGEKTSLTRLNRLQGRFVAMASHEFKTPLTSITAYTDVLRTQLTDEEFPHASEFLDVIKTEADRLLRMVNRILDFTRMEYGSQLMNREPTDLMPLVQDTVRGLQPAIQDKNLTLQIEAEERLPRAVVDADLIRQVLVNLVGNAVKFTPHGGTVSVMITEMESAVAVNVADDGPGIPVEDIRRVFREFYRADATAEREEGTGLGLTIARHIVNLHGGHIEARRREVGGSEFRFLVPKETGHTTVLSRDEGSRATAQETQNLIDELMRLVAELTGSRAVALLLRDGNGALVPAGAMGWEMTSCKVRPVIESEGWSRFLQTGQAASDPQRIAADLQWCPDGEDNRNMFAPLGAGDNCQGVLITGRRRGGGTYEAQDLVQVTVLAEVARAALNSRHTSVGRTIEAVRLLLKIRRTGVPTSTPEALDLLAKLARSLGVGETGARRIQYAAALHDAGMARVEEEITLGGGSLDVDERDEVDRHVEQGVELMAPLLADAATTDIMRHHHEKFDGTGYPTGLKAAEIPLGARLLAVIDAWFSLTRDRSFRRGLPPAAALTEIEAHAGSQFDPEIVRAFADLVRGEGLLDPVPHGAGTDSN